MSAAGIVLVDDVDTCRAAVDSLMKEVEVAVDIEGIDLGRHPGKVCIVQVCGRASRTVYLFDISTLQGDAFEAGGLASLLESSDVLKVFFDVRSDTDALFHNHQVRVRGAYDLQVLYHLKFCGPKTNYLTGLKKVLGEYGATEIPAEEMRSLESLKEQGLHLFAPERGGTYAVWEKRPLSAELVQYCAADVEYLLNMKDFWGKSALDGHVLEISEKRIGDFIDTSVIMKDTKARVDFRIPAGLKPELPDGKVEQTVQVPQSKVGAVIGKGGSKIKSIQADSGASVSMNESSARVVGTLAQVESAVRLIRSVL